MAKLYGEHTTEGGTKLPLINLKGKPYLQVAHRLVWFREKYPSGIIKTSIIKDQDDEAVARAEIYITVDNGQPLLVATGHKTESKARFADFREKAETGAIGRALALAGIGTQFCETDLDEEDRLADAPVALAKKSLEAKKKTSFRSEVVEDDL